MKTMTALLHRWALPALLLAATPALALAVPIAVGTSGGTGPQSVIMCPHCGGPIACAQAGDYNISFSADSIHPKTGTARFSIGVTDRTGKPVTDAKVALVLTMPAHHHGSVTVPVSGGKKGEYSAVTTLSPHMRGQWVADVQITTPRGDKVTQAFTLEQ
jgi:hypothetical protein